MYVRPVLNDGRHTVATKLIIEGEVGRPHVVRDRQCKRLHVSPGLEEADYRVDAHTKDKAADRHDDAVCELVVRHADAELGKEKAADGTTEQRQPSECLRERIVKRVPKPPPYVQPRSLPVHSTFPEISQSRGRRVRRVIRFHQLSESRPAIVAPSR